MVCFGTPVLLADLFVLSPGYQVPPDLATVPQPFSMRSLHSWCPQCRFKCSKWRCRHRDVKCVMTSWTPIKGPAWIGMLFFGYRLPIEPSAMFVQPCALPEPFRRSSLFSLSNKAAFELIASESQCNLHRDESSEPHWRPLRLVLEL